MLRFIFLLAFSAALTTTFAQDSPLKFGEIDKKNLEMTIYPNDSSAGAVVLMNWGYINFDHNFEVQFQHHIRIKILNKSEFDRADVEIPYYRRDRVERLKAATYNLEDGKVVSHEIDKDDIFDENSTEYINKLKFSLQNVREGSIIEYTYRVNYGSYSQILPWYFQMDIPVMHSEYYVELPEIFEYKKVMRGYIPLEEAEVAKKNINYQGTPLRLTTQRYIARNVPAFRDEPFLTTKDDFISRISFELYAISVPGSTYQRVMPDSYEQLSRKLALDTDFGKRLEKGRFLRDHVEELTAGTKDDEEKTRAIYKFVQEEFELDYDYDEENYKKIFEARRGYARDINFILIMMLKEAGIEAEPVMISTRKHGFIHPAYPSARNFNYMLALTTVGENSYLLDASDKYLPFGTIGEKCLNGRGLVISENKPRWVDLTPSFNNTRMITGKCRLTGEGNLEADLKIDRGGYLAMKFRRDRSDEDDDYENAFRDEHDDWKIASHDIAGLESPESSLVETLSLEAKTEQIGNLIYLTPLLMGNIETNPFVSRERTFPVNYGAPVKDIFSYTIEIPEGYEVDELPQPVALAMPENTGRFLYNVTQMGNKIMINAQFMINRVEFSSEEYPYVKAFYAQVVAKEAEQIVLKKKT